MGCVLRFAFAVPVGLILTNTATLLIRPVLVHPSRTAFFVARTHARTCHSPTDSEIAYTVPIIYCARTNSVLVQTQRIHILTFPAGHNDPANSDQPEDM